MSRQLRRCSAVAWRRRGNHVSGTDRRRPSARTTDRSWSSTRTSVARGSASGPEELTPCLQELTAMLGHQTLEVPQLVPSQTAVGNQRYGLQPELGRALTALDVDVGRLADFVAGAEDARGADAQDRRRSE